MFFNDEVNNMRKETETFELKKSLSQLREGIISLSAMLNKHHEGEVIFGINDQGRVCGVTIGDKTKNETTQRIQNNLKPLPQYLDVDVDKAEGKDIIRVIAKGDDTPYSAYDRYYIRVDDADIVMDAHTLQKYFESKDDTYSKWEKQPTPYGIEIIDENQLIDFFRQANDRGRVDYVYRNSREALEKLGLLTKHGYLNKAGYYLFSASKPLTIKLAYFPLESRVEFGTIKEFQGNIFECILESVSFILSNIQTKSKLTMMSMDLVSEIPLQAIREIVINAFAHCDYRKVGQYHQISIFPDCVKIFNPGPVVQGIDPLRFANGQIGTKVRNPLIASVLFKAGLVEAFGTGFERTFSLCEKEHLSYEYSNNEFGFTFCFKRNTDFLNSKVEEEAIEFDRKMDVIDQEIIDILRRYRLMTVEEIAMKINSSNTTVYQHLEKLRQSDVVKRIGREQISFWEMGNY